MISSRSMAPALLGLCAFVSACSGDKKPATPSDSTPPAEEIASPCNAAGLSDLVGKAADAALIADAVKRSGSRTMRVIRPGMAVTMDYRDDRLNIDVDDNNKVTGTRCG